MKHITNSAELKKTVFIFHGTEGYPEENWFPWLKQNLEKLNCRVYVPQFPSPPKIPAKISDWFDVLKKYDDKINQDTILIGHSLGGIFVLRLLEKLNHPVKAGIFIGTPVGVRPILNYDRDKSFSGFDFDWNNVKKKAKQFLVFQSDDDPYVCLGNGEYLSKKLNVPLHFVPNAGHFNKQAGYTEFELLLEKLKPII